MSIKVAINGFGRIGRLAFRRIEEVGGMEVVAINDLTDAANLAYLLKYDSAHGSFAVEDIIVSEYGKAIVYKGRAIPVIGQPDPKLIDWSEFESISYSNVRRFRGKADASVHLDKGVKGVLISAPTIKGTSTFVFVLMNTNFKRRSCH